MKLTNVNRNLVKKTADTGGGGGLELSRSDDQTDFQKDLQKDLQLCNWKDSDLSLDLQKMISFKIIDLN